jgi:hypothetical protein
MIYLLAHLFALNHQVLCESDTNSLGVCAPNKQGIATFLESLQANGKGGASSKDIQQTIIDLVDHRGLTALMLLVREGARDQAVQLAAGGADVEVKNAKGQTLFDFASPEMAAAINHAHKPYAKKVHVKSEGKGKGKGKSKGKDTDRGKGKDKNDNPKKSKVGIIDGAAAIDKGKNSKRGTSTGASISTESVPKRHKRSHSSACKENSGSANANESPTVKSKKRGAAAGTQHPPKRANRAREASAPALPEGK